jgi:hypothetical protein
MKLVLPCSSADQGARAVMAVSLITQGRRGTHAKPLCLRCQCSVLECTSTAQPYRKGPHASAHGPQLAMQMLSCIDKWRTRCAPPLVKPASRIRELAQQTMRVEQASGSIVSAWTWQELAQPEVLVIYRTQRAVAPFWSKSPAPACSRTATVDCSYMHRAGYC